MNRFVAWLDGPEPLPTSVAGGKGASLSRLGAAGLPVPPGFVVTAEGYRHFHRSCGLDDHLPPLTWLAGRPQLSTVRDASAGLIATLADCDLPEDLGSAIEAAHSELEARATSGAKFAVRSSAATEDGAHASFAGLYESYLNLRGAAAIRSAVKDCYTCLWHPRATQYRTVKGMDHAREAMAVVVMETIVSAASGVAFTMNPVTGDTGQIMVNASWGLGEAVVSGIVTPDSWILARDGSTLSEDIRAKRVEIIPGENGTEHREVPTERANQPSLDSAQTRHVAEVAIAVERLYGGPVDIEFAFDARGRFSLLQARPVTTR